MTCQITVLFLTRSCIAPGDNDRRTIKLCCRGQHKLEYAPESTADRVATHRHPLINHESGSVLSHLRPYLLVGHYCPRCIFLMP